MKKSLYILILLLVPVIGKAQSTAVMEVKVNVIRGVQVENPHSINILDKSDKGVPSIIFTSFPYSDVTISTDSHLVLKNNSGKQIKVKTDSLLKSNYTSGIHQLSIDGIIQENLEPESSYKGSVKTVINYF